MIDSSKLCLYIPNGIGTKKYVLYKKVAQAMRYVTNDERELDKLPPDIIPVIGGTVSLRPLVQKWKANKRNFIYWDRGYFRRIYEAWLPKSEETHGGYYRFNLNCCSMARIRDVPSDRWERLDTPIQLWQDDPAGHIVVAPSLPEHDLFHGIEGWLPKTIAWLEKAFPDREIINRFRNSEKPLYEELKGAKCLVTHGSNAANEAVVMGYPIIAFGDCAAALVGGRSLADIFNLQRPDRTKWCHSMAYNQYTEDEIVDGTAFRLMDDGRS